MFFILFIIQAQYYLYGRVDRYKSYEINRLKSTSAIIKSSIMVNIIDTDLLKFMHTFTAPETEAVGINTFYKRIWIIHPLLPIVHTI